MLGAGRAQQVDGVPIEEDDRPQVDGELEVEALGLDVRHRRSEPDAGVVDEDVEPPVALQITP